MGETSRRLLALLAAALVPLGALAATPGDRMIALPDKRKVHLVCSGAGAPTVLLESGFGADSGAWYKVQPLVARYTRVCSYDRAGYGKSSPGPLPRDGEAIAADLDAALRAAHVGGPYVLVGHSAGGLYMRLLAARRPGQVTGLVLVDPSVEHQTRRIAAEFGPGAGSVDGIRESAARCLNAVEARAKGIPDPAAAACGPGSAGLWRTQVSEIETLFTTTSDQVVAKRPRVRDVPTTILTATPNEGPTLDPGERLHRRMHAELAGEFRTARQQLVRSGHLMMLDRPEVIAQAVGERVRAWRSRRR
ncbi:MAG: hypothetical protein JWO33_1526 [Caulobacteraceae bacterium]|nr:hypothetical protein [Caulobacteraceae bacterium]